jgi:hypothetical protein
MNNHIGRRLALIGALPSLAGGEGGNDLHFDLSCRLHAVSSALEEAVKLRATDNSLAAGIALYCRTQLLINTQITPPRQFSTLVCLCHLSVQ